MMHGGILKLFSDRFGWNWCSKSRCNAVEHLWVSRREVLYLGAWRKICLFFYIVLSFDLKEVRYWRTTCYAVMRLCLACGSARWKKGLISVCTFHTCCSILVKFGIRVLHIIRRNFCESREYQRRVACTFMMGVNEIKFTRVTRSCNILKLKATLVTSVL
jgi:hypothetical protein